MKYMHLSDEERHLIAALRKLGKSMRAIAKELDRSPATISREVKRNAYTTDGRYRAFHAGSKYRGRRSRARQGTHYTEEQWKEVRELICRDYSPEQISGWLKKEGRMTISHETIYQYILRDRKRGGKLYKHLRHSRKQRRKRYGKYDSRGVLAGKKPIEERPTEANERSEIGHREIDTVHGKGKEAIATIVDRMTGFVLIGQLDNKTVRVTNKRLTDLISKFPESFKTITSDNGTEFHGYKKLEQKFGIEFYFAKPYHSWERGSNENTNGLIRQYLPKGQSMKNLTQAKCNAIANRLNNRPRKRHGYQTPNELFFGC